MELHAAYAGLGVFFPSILLRDEKTYFRALSQPPFLQMEDELLEAATPERSSLTLHAPAFVTRLIT